MEAERQTGLPADALIIRPTPLKVRRFGRLPGMSWKLYLSGYFCFAIVLVTNLLGRNYAFLVFYAAMPVIATVVYQLFQATRHPEWYLFLTATALGKRNVNAARVWDRSRIGRMEIVRTYMYPRRVTIFRNWLVLISWDDRVLDWTQVDGYDNADLEKIAATIGVGLTGSFDQPITPQEFASRYPRGWAKYRPNTYSATARWSQLDEVVKRFRPQSISMSPQPPSEARGG